MKTKLIILLIGFAFVGCGNDNNRHYEYYDNSQIKWSGIVVDGKQDGEWVECYPDGSIKMEVFFKNGNRHGTVSIWYNNEEMNTGQMRAKGDYLNDMKEGKHTFWHENGQFDAKGEFKKNKEEGLWTLWFDNGQKRKEVSYIKGLKEGKVIEWHDNGEKRLEGNYISNKIEGKLAEWNEDGKLIREFNYENGIATDSTKY